MRIYLYNSYKGSPVGFVMGMLERLPDGSFSPLVGSGIPERIRNCFEYALIKNVLGDISIFSENSGSPSWLLLLKNLICKTENAENDFAWYLNIAFETCEMANLVKWLEGDDCQNLACLFTNCLAINRDSKFGYTVLSDRLAEFLQGSFASSAIPEKVKQTFKKGCCINFQNKLPETERLNFVSQKLAKNRNFSIFPSNTQEAQDWSLVERRQEPTCPHMDMWYGPDNPWEIDGQEERPAENQNDSGPGGENEKSPFAGKLGKRLQSLKKTVKEIWQPKKQKQQMVKEASSISREPEEDKETE